MNTVTFCNESAKEVGLFEGTVDGDVDRIHVGIKEGSCEVVTEGRLEIDTLGSEDARIVGFMDVIDDGLFDSVFVERLLGT